MTTASQALVEHDEPGPIQRIEPIPAPVTPMAMIDRALMSGAAPETLEKLLSLQERWEANQGRKAFDEAMAAAKSEIPVIGKNRHVGYKHKDGGGDTSYYHEDLGEIARTIDPILAKHGLSYRFRTTAEPNQPVSVTCIVAHRDGYSESNTLSAGRDESGKKNAIQAIGSTITYLQRYTLKAALGLAASRDDDGQAHGKNANDLTTISNEQRDHILALIAETQTDIEKFCEVGRIEGIPDMLASDYPAAVAMLEAKKRKLAS